MPSGKATTVLLYLTPEAIQTEKIRAVLKTLYHENRLAMFAVDEAHCLSTWGHDFRSSYRKLQYIRTTFPNTICMALTATATPQVIEDVQNELALQGRVHIGSFDRPNIYYMLKHKDALENPLDDLVKYVVDRHTAAAAAATTTKTTDGKTDRDNHPADGECSGIVYVHKREETSMIARAIAKQGISAAAYHAGLKKADRLAVQEGWSTGTIQVAVATVAFGMGIDRHCVRYVVHWCLPKSIEGFYQEAGRAGRDGLPSHSRLYYSPDDVGKFKYLIRMQSSSGSAWKNADTAAAAQRNMERKLEQLEEMQEYCTQLKCRRNTLISYFGGAPVVCGKTCDVCNNPEKVERMMRASTAIKDVRRQHQNFSKKKKKNGKHNQPWDGQWTRPYGDDDDDAIANDWGDNCLMAGDLKVTGPLEVDPGDYSSSHDSIPDNTNKFGTNNRRGGFRKASDILSKYESMEDHEINNDPPSRTSTTPNIFNIPEHLKESLKAASDFTTANKLQTNKKRTTKVLSSADHAKNVDKIQDRLAKLQAEKAEREKKLKSLLAKRSNR